MEGKMYPVSCCKCGLLKLQIMQMTFFSESYIELDLICDACGSTQVLPIGKGIENPAPDIREIALNNVKKKIKKTKVKGGTKR